MPGDNVLVLGSGARESAIALAVAQSPHVEKVYFGPGNGTSHEKIEVVPSLDLSKNTMVADFAADSEVVLTIVGPEKPLVDGLADEFAARDLLIFGPRSEAAMLEGSKIYAKGFMRDHNVPTADYGVFSSPDTAYDWIDGPDFYPCAVKADGLAGGKGVVVCSTRAEARAAVRMILKDRKFGTAGNRIVIERKLNGRELSVQALVHNRGGTSFYVMLPSSLDYKRLGNGDNGPNTGGMGVVSPNPFVDGKTEAEVRRRILDASLRGLNYEEIDFVGTLYPGLMLTAVGPQVLEYNVRGGDPETQGVLPRLASDLYEMLFGIARGEKVESRWNNNYAIGVVLAMEGYPIDTAGGDAVEITGIADAEGLGATVYHAATARDGDKVYTIKGKAPGRILTVVHFGDTLEKARENAYGAADKINFPGKYFRDDIGLAA